MDRPALVTLDAKECLELLAGQHIGRLGVVVHDEPVILPVTYALHGGEVVFRTNPGGKLHAAVWKARVAFEVDGVDPADRTGWSVLIRGTARTVERGQELADLEDLGLVPWAGGPKSHYVKISTDVLTGRRIPADGRLADLWLG